MLNSIVVMGRLTSDPEMRHTESGTAVTSFSIACERDFKNKDGSKDADFISCVAWRNTAEFISNYFTKGSMIIVSGRLQMRSYTDKNGNKRTAAEVVIDNGYFGDSKKTAENANNGFRAGEIADLPDDDIPGLPF